MSHGCVSITSHMRCIKGNLNKKRIRAPHNTRHCQRNPIVGSSANYVREWMPFDDCGPVCYCADIATTLTVAKLRLILISLIITTIIEILVLCKLQAKLFQMFVTL